MKKTFTLLCLLPLASLTYAGTPIIDGIYNAGEGWGTAVATGDNAAGWSNANAKTLYVTYDNNYVYLAADVSAESWQQFIFAVNTKPGGSSTDSWGRSITYAHSNPPDFLFRGDIAGSNYAEYHVWNGTMWTGTGTNINAAGTEVKSTWSGNNGFLEIRVPRTTLTGWPATGNVQFIIGGNNNDHGSFDAIPNDDNSDGWNPPTSATTLTQYVNNVALPLKLTTFNGSMNNNQITLSWQTLNEANLSHFDIELSNDGNIWNKAATVPSNNTTQGSSYIKTVAASAAKKQFARLKVIEKDGKYTYSATISFKAGSTPKFELLGNPVKSDIKISINSEATAVTAELISLNGKTVLSQNYKHQGGSSTLQLQLNDVRAGMYILNLISDGSKQSFKVVVQ